MRLLKFRPNYLFAGLLTAILFTQTWKTAANYHNTNFFCIPLTAPQDTVPQKNKDSLARRPQANLPDTLRKDSLNAVKVVPDTIINKVDTFDLVLSKDTLDAPVNYEADDSVVVLVKDKKVILYGKTKTTYKDVEIKAPQMEVDQ
jgi:hypothetical protein